MSRNAIHRRPASCPTLRPLRGPEPLEERSLLATGITAVLQANGTLAVTGTNSNDTITLRQTGTTLRVDGMAQTFAVASVKQIKVDGLAGDDTISLCKTASDAVTIGSLLSGGAGNDILTGSRANDQLLGNAGNDVLLGCAGNDTLLDFSGNNVLDGGLGNDSLQTGEGTDTLLGGLGADLLLGGAGNDYLLGADGDDQLFGQAGADRLLGGAGNDRLDGGTNPTTFWGPTSECDWLEAGSADEYAVRGWNAHRWVLDGTTREDVRQGYTGNCSFCSAMMTAAKSGMNLQSRITYQGNFLYHVTLFDPVRNAWSVQAVRFDGSMTLSSRGIPTEPLTTPEGEFWTVLFQRAYLKLSGYDPTNGPRIENFPGDSLVRTLSIVTGRSVGWDVTSRLTPQALADRLTRGDLVTTGSRCGLEHDLIVGCHAYVVDAVYQANGVWYVRVINPWGFDGYKAQGANDGLITLNWAQFQACYDHYAWASKP